MVGVGGQGVILMSELLGNAAVVDGVSVRGSEVLGMAVRGGSVVSAIRMGSEVYGPLIPAGKCDILLGMEPSEALRNIVYLSKSGSVILNTQIVVPFTVSLGKSDYPGLEQIVDKIKGVAGRVVVLNAVQIAEEIGSPLSANIVMLGALFGTGQIPVKIETIKKVVRARFPAKLSSGNIKAFDLGYQMYHSLSSKS
ncbi:indolepyruvate oxidoreductase subunit beta [Chloroflexota bacterium]